MTFSYPSFSSFSVLLSVFLVLAFVTSPHPPKVTPSLRDQVVSNSIFCEPSEPSDNQPTSTSKCVSDSNFSPDGDRTFLNADLNRWCEGKNVHLFVHENVNINAMMGKLKNSSISEAFIFYEPFSRVKVIVAPI